MDNNGKVLVGLVSAVAVGVVIGMAFAPNDGSKNRKKVKGAINDYAKQLLDAVTSAKDTVADKAEDAMDTLRGKANEAKGYANAKIDQAKKEIEAV